MKSAIFFFLYQVFNYSTLCWNFRSVAQANYVHAVITDGMLAAVGFVAIKKVAKAESRWEHLGWILGGMVGSVTGIWLSIYFLGK